MALTSVDLATFAKQVEEAQKLLADRAAVEREIAQARREHARLVEANGALDQRLGKQEQAIAAAEQRFIHEKARHVADLDAAIDNCKQQKAAAQRQHEADLAELDRKLAQHQDACDAQVRELQGTLVGLQSQRAVLLAAVRDFKVRIAALPS